MLLSTGGFRLEPIHFCLCDEEGNPTSKGQDGQDTWVELLMTPRMSGCTGRFQLTKEFQSYDEVSVGLPHKISGEGGTEAFGGRQVVEA